MDKLNSKYKRRREAIAKTEKKTAKSALARTIRISGTRDQQTSPRSRMVWTDARIIRNHPDVWTTSRSFGPPTTAATHQDYLDGCPDHPDPQPDDPDRAQTIRTTTRTIRLTASRTPEGFT